MHAVANHRQFGRPSAKAMLPVNSTGGMSVRESVPTGS